MSASKGGHVQNSMFYWNAKFTKCKYLKQGTKNKNN